jgi:ATP-dependent Clp protease ATP-binding subunit ClpB
MDLNRFTHRSQQALQQAVTTATNRGNPEVRPVHLLHAILADSENAAGPILQRIGVDRAEARAAVEQALEHVPAAHGTTAQPSLSRGLSQVLSEAERHAEQLGDEYVSVEHLLLALAESDDPADRVLTERGATAEALLNGLRQVRGSQRVTSQDPEQTYEALEKYAPT